MEIQPNRFCSFAEWRRLRTDPRTGPAAIFDINVGTVGEKQREYVVTEQILHLIKETWA